MGKITGKMTFKNKMGMALACAALIGTLGAGTAFAANIDSFISGGMSSSNLGVKSINVAPSGESLVMHIVKNGTHLYSVDSGETWNDAIPDGFRLDGQGNLQKIK